MPDPENLTLERQTPDQNPKLGEADQQWEARVRAWLSTIPEGKTVTVDEFEAWINANHALLPDQLKSIPLPVLYERFIPIQNSTGPSVEGQASNLVDPHHARFQRTDQWMPVYSWLESLDTDEVVKTKDILDWLSENPEVKEQLYSRHSRYHLMHYVKKCHVKILKRKEKKKGLQPINKTNSVQVQKTGDAIVPVPLPCTALSHLPKDGDLYMAKRSEALRKYEILLELEKELYTILPNCERAKQ
ncbi:uncharacterized protein LOC127796017 isoform X2 [Diospyros lotus]|uniref:uncharacterized protein LOC127796017 isoform X2 n=1 Tax=Diospyros lotus TaxID=55363 RepID=UPI002254796C|nr:uncharacterized protein LOC127796017 isoform X2 [Diospyros lotus]